MCGLSGASTGGRASGQNGEADTEDDPLPIVQVKSICALVKRYSQEFSIQQ